VAREIRLVASGRRPTCRLSRTERVIGVRLHAALDGRTDARI
jgi:hypothetical protein